MKGILGAAMLALFLSPPSLAQTAGQSLDAELDVLRAHEVALSADNVAVRADLAAITDTVSDLAGRLSALENAEPMPDPDPVPAPVPSPVGFVFAPPSLIDPIVVNVGLPKWRYGCYPADRDVLIRMPATVFRGGLEVCGGRNVRMIGGHIVTAKGQKARRGFVITGAPSGEFFVEGLHVNTNRMLMDAMASRLRRKGYGDPWGFVLTFQNVRVEGLNGKPSGPHADIFQAQGPIGTLRLENFTGRSGFNGLILGNRPDGRYPARGVRNLEMRNADFDYENFGTPHSSLAIDGKGANKILPESVRFDNVWMNCFTRPGKCKSTVVEPRIGRGTRFDAGPPPRIFMDSMNAEGFISAGVPPGGDFAPASAVGLNYVSPWPLPGN